MNTTEEYQQSETRRWLSKVWSDCTLQAISDLKSGDDDIKITALKWFKNTTNDGIGSFIWVCNLFDFDVDKNRKAILGMKNNV